MILKGVTNVTIARRTGVSETWVSLVICGHERSVRIRKAIAEMIGVAVEELWPEEKDKDKAA